MSPADKWLCRLDACAGSVLTPHDYITNVQKRLGNIVWTGFGTRTSLDPQLEHGETYSTAEATRRHYACVHAVACGLKLVDPGIATEPTRAHSIAIQATTAVVPGRSAALDVCDAPPNAAAARGDAAQASFDRKLSHYRNEVPNLRNQGIHDRLLFWTTDGRPHPVTRTLQYATARCPRNRSNACGNTKSR